MKWVGSVAVFFILPMILLVLAFAGTELNMAYWDWKVREMCKKDGGVVVYERINLTFSEYNRLDGSYGTIPVPSETASYSDKYPYLSRSKKTIIHESGPTVYKRVGIIYRKHDGKILGKMTNYRRSGGDFPTIIGHPSGYDCKDLSVDLDVEKQIFHIQGE